MLVIHRKYGQSIVLDTPAGRITVTIVGAGTDRILLGIDAPPEVLILREELIGRMGAAGKAHGRGRDEKKDANND